jgi:SsrA-binding protein
MKIVANNKKAFHDYFIEDKFEAGLELFGWEVKTARASQINLQDSFVWFTPNGEAFLKNAHFSPYKDGVVTEQNPKRDRKLLLKRAQIEKLHTRVKAKGYTCVVTKIYLNPRGLVKAEVALARGKHTYDKKQTLKERDIKREVENEIKQKRK